MKIQKKTVKLEVEKKIKNAIFLEILKGNIRILKIKKRKIQIRSHLFRSKRSRKSN